MQERISLVKAEVETRGLSWTEFQSKEEIEKLDKQEPGVVAETNGERHSAWTDGTFQTGRIVNGEVVMDDVAGGGQAQQGGSIGDEELRRRMEERMRDMGVDDEGGMHL